MYNVIEHIYVPKHILLTAEEAEEVLRRWKINPRQLPKILTRDPCVKALGAKVGDIIEIHRPSPTAGTAIFYRVVVEG